MEDFNAVDAALDYGYYQGQSEGLPLIILAVGLIVLVQWALSLRHEQR